MILKCHTFNYTWKGIKYWFETFEDAQRSLRALLNANFIPLDKSGVYIIEREIKINIPKEDK